MSDYDSDPQKTIFKIIGGRKTRETFWLIKAALVFALLLVAVCSVQIVLCKNDHPGRDWKRCLAPMLMRD